MSEEKKYITLENLAYFLEKFKEALCDNDSENSEKKEEKKEEGTSK